jgi:hypothetical protein
LALDIWVEVVSYLEPSSLFELITASPMLMERFGAEYVQKRVGQGIRFKPPYLVGFDKSALVLQFLPFLYRLPQF